MSSKEDSPGLGGSSGPFRGLPLDWAANLDQKVSSRIDRDELAISQAIQSRVEEEQQKIRAAAELKTRRRENAQPTLDLIGVPDYLVQIRDHLWKTGTITFNPELEAYELGLEHLSNVQFPVIPSVAVRSIGDGGGFGTSEGGSYLPSSRTEDGYVVCKQAITVRYILGDDAQETLEIQDWCYPVKEEIRKRIKMNSPHKNPSDYSFLLYKTSFGISHPFAEARDQLSEGLEKAWEIRRKAGLYPERIKEVMAAAAIIDAMKRNGSDILRSERANPSHEHPLDESLDHILHEYNRTLFKYSYSRYKKWYRDPLGLEVAAGEGIAFNTQERKLALKAMVDSGLYSLMLESSLRLNGYPYNANGNIREHINNVALGFYWDKDEKGETRKISDGYEMTVYETHYSTQYKYILAEACPDGVLAFYYEGPRGLFSRRVKPQTLTEQTWRNNKDLVAQTLRHAYQSPFIIKSSGSERYKSHHW